MVHLVGALDESRFVGLDAQLHFDHHTFPIHQIDQEILGYRGQSIPHTHDPQQFWPVMVDPAKLLIQGDDLGFFGVAPASQKVAKVEGDQIHS